ncbi:MAG: CBS domain-containing protein [Candidatus Hadarchaeota archaeon]
MKRALHYQSHDRGPLSFKSHVHKKEGDIMAIARKSVFTAPPTTPIKAAAELMVKHQVRRLPIIRPGTKRIEGMVRSREIVDFLGGGEKNMIIRAKFKDNFHAAVNEPVNIIMVRDFPHGEVTMSMEEAARLLLQTGFGGAPILDRQGQVEGIISDRDFISFVPPTAGTAVSYYMVRHLVTAEPELSINEAAKRIVSRGVRRLPVVRGRELVGIVTTVDILRYFASGRAFERMRSNPEGGIFGGQVQEIMTKEVISVSPDADVGEAAALMKEKGCGGMPVVSGRELLGIITERDLLRLLV